MLCRAHWEEMSRKKASYRVADHVSKQNDVVLKRAQALHDKMLRGGGRKGAEVRIELA